MNVVQTYKIGYFSPEILEKMNYENPYMVFVINYMKGNLPIYGETIDTDMYAVNDLRDNINNFPNSEEVTEEYLMENGVSYQEILSFIEYCDYLDIKVIEVDK